MPDEDTQAYPLDETVDKVEPESGDLEKREAMSSLHVLNKVEDVSDALLCRFDTFYFIMELLWYFNNQFMKKF